MECTVFSLSEECPTRKPLQQGDLSAFKGKIRFSLYQGTTHAPHTSLTLTKSVVRSHRLCTCLKTTQFCGFKGAKGRGSGCSFSGATSGSGERRARG